MTEVGKHINLSDEQLAVLSLDNHSFFSILIDRYKGRLLSYIRRMSLVSAEDAEDLLQEVFLKVYLNLNSFEQDLKFSSWIYSITRHQIISNYRKLKVRPEGNSVKIDQNLIVELVSGIQLDSELDQQLLNQQIFAALDQLKPKWREILILKFFEEKDYQEMSDIIKKPQGTVASMLHKAKQEFKKIYLEKHTNNQ